MGGARFCTNCGAQLGTEPTNPRVLPSPTDTAERVYDVGAPAYLTPHHRTRRPGAGLWAGIVGVLVTVLLVGGFLLLHGGGSDGSLPEAAGEPDRASGGASPPGPSSPGESGSGSPSPSTAQVKGPPSNVAGFAHAAARRHAPPGEDFAGRPVTYVAANMVDGRNDTCWRVQGAATGTVLTFRLDQPTRLTRVGLVNGYAKVAYSHDRSFDWYRGNRRVLAVQWLFDGGRSVIQQLGFDRGMQQVAIKPVTTSVVRLRITSVSAPGKGRAARNDTAISEVLLLGRTG
jgi:hypothetical protein